MRKEVVIETRELTIRFGSFTAVDRLTLAIRRGCIFGFLGPNGSGKSTTIRMLCGILQPTSGSCFVLGYDVASEAEKVKQRIGYMSQKFSLYPDLTVQENLEFYAGLYSVPHAQRQERIAEMLAMAGLEEQQDVMTGALSTGVRQRLSLGCAILHRPEIVFLDEPTSGVDPKSRRLFWEIIYRLAGNGTTVLITTHFMDEAEHCDEVGFINGGVLAANGTPEQLKSSIAYTLVNIPAADSIALLERLRSEGLSLFDAYTFGSNLRLLLKQEQLCCLKGLVYEILTPSMEDVFAYYVRLQRRREEGLC